MPGEHDSDEIDLIDLIKIIIKRKFVVLITTVFFVSAAGLWLFMKPVSYIATAEIAIGKIAGVPIDAGREIELYLETLDSHKNADYEYKVKSEISKIDGISISFNLAVTGYNKENVNNALSSILEKIMQRQDSVYKDAKEEFLKVKRNDKWGFIDRKGNIIIDFQYQEERRLDFDKILKLNTDSLDTLPKATYRNVGFFNEGLASIQKDSLYGFINLKNEIVIEPIFKGVRWFSEGLAGATLDGEIWGFINKEGKFEIEPKYFCVDAFKNGICGVNLTNTPLYVNDYFLNAIINKNNEILFVGEMHSYLGFEGELIKYYEGWDFGGRIHYLDKNGKPIIPKE